MSKEGIHDIGLHCLSDISFALLCILAALLCFALGWVALPCIALHCVALRCFAVLFSHYLVLLCFLLLCFILFHSFYPGSYTRAREDYRWTGSRITAGWNERRPETSRTSEEIRAKDPVLNEQTAWCRVKWGARWQNNVRWLGSQAFRSFFL